MGVGCGIKAEVKGGGGMVEKIQKLKIGEGTIIRYSRLPLKMVLIASCISFTFENGFD